MVAQIPVLSVSGSNLERDTDENRSALQSSSNAGYQLFTNIYLLAKQPNIILS